MSKPFSTYPEDHAKMLALADAILNLDDEDNRKAIELADIVQAILRDEAIADGQSQDPAALDLLKSLKLVREYRSIDYLAQAELAEMDAAIAKAEGRS